MFNYQAYQNVDRVDKVKYAFMVNSIMSIKFPIHANTFNYVGVKDEYIVDMWAMIMNRQRLTEYPKWTKLIGTKPIKTVLSEFTDETVAAYMRMTKLTSKDVECASKLIPQTLKKELHRIQQQLGQINK